MTGPRTISATFTLAPKAMIGVTGYDSLRAAYSAAVNGALIMALDAEMPDAGLTIDSALGNDKTVTIRGGYNADYTVRTGLPTYLKSFLQLSSGAVVIDGLVIK
jgi:hypothetical protein